MFVYMVIVTIFLWMLYIFLKRTPLDSIPGPRGLPLIGNVWSLNDDGPHLQIDKWAKQFGSVYKLMLVNNPVVVISGCDELYEILIKKGKEFAGRPYSQRAETGVPNTTDIFFANYSPEQRWRRRLVHSFMKQFGSVGMKKIEDTTETCVSDLVNDLNEANGKPVEIHSLLYKCFVDIISIMANGIPTEKKERKTMRFLTEALLLSMATGGSGQFVDAFPWLRFFGNIHFKNLALFKKEAHKLVKPWLENALNDDRKEGFVHRFFEVPDEEKTEFNYNKQVVESQLWQTVFTSGSTSSTGIALLCNVLVFHSEVQKKLQQEVDEVVGKSRSVTLEDKRKMPYHQAVLYELMRYGSIVPMGLNHMTTENTTVNKYTVPAGTEVWINLWGLHHDDHWDEPYKFDPGRFLDADGQFVLADHPNRKHLLPFGAGTRVCVGEIFAQTRMFLALAALMQKFTILPERDLSTQPSCDPRTLLKTGIITEPKPFKVRMIQL